MKHLERQAETGWPNGAHKPESPTVGAFSVHDGFGVGRSRVCISALCEERPVKLFYKEHNKHACYSQNWGASKGVHRYQDVCVALNPVNVKAWQNGSFRNINTETRNKLYVACSRARGNLTFVPESLLKSYKRS